MARIPTLGPRVPTLDTRKAKPLPKKADPHYQTAEHEAWAAFVKRRAGYRCEHIDDRTGRRCERSQANGDRMYADHIKDIKDRPDLALDRNNGRCACNSHNTRAGIAARSRRMKS
ncbi:HNH endonuclease [Bradyrhizobium sp. Leo170]|uniref:HNH endonuclease n=1 Tax=Bradyrhizobium sp. Leo170 TaxID=1571199 RepID=UPI00102E9B89|nr:HNH endonuclease [Bradyrhizobium sp. Leo170]TAI67602.1 HNH endonuclease [Bradyrhizobium sp. Leo170]